MTKSEAQAIFDSTPSDTIDDVARSLALWWRDVIQALRTGQPQSSIHDHMKDLTDIDPTASRLCDAYKFLPQIIKDDIIGRMNVMLIRIKQGKSTRSEDMWVATQPSSTG